MLEYLPHKCLRRPWLHRCALLLRIHLLEAAAGVQIGSEWQSSLHSQGHIM